GSGSRSPAPSTSSSTWTASATGRAGSSRSARSPGWKTTPSRPRASSALPARAPPQAEASRGTSSRAACALASLTGCRSWGCPPRRSLRACFRDWARLGVRHSPDERTGPFRVEMAAVRSMHLVDGHHTQTQEAEMRLVATEYLSLDGVFEEPGHWSFPFFGQEAGQFKWSELQASDALLMGRKTYEGFAAAWPTMEGTGEFGEKMNSMPKYVVSSALEQADWAGSILVKGDLATEIGKLKANPGQDLLLSGSRR